MFKIKPYPFYIMFTFVITFTLFPGPTFVKPFRNIENTWAVIFFNIFYNIGDTVGKYIAELKGAFNPKSLAYVFFARLFFFFPVTFMAKGLDEDDPMTNNEFFPFFDVLIFAITNGFCISTSSFI
jgi:solute carrier family 29 (equilibrative nucleoside transporter), member 1/2/3